MKCWILVAFLALSSLLHADTVLCFTNFPIDEAMYTRFLKERGCDAKVVVHNIKDYAPLLRKKKGMWNRLKRACDFRKVPLADDVDKVIFFNISPKVACKYDLSKFPREKLVLFMWEPKTVLQQMYLPHIQRCFSRIYTWNDVLVDGKTYFKFHYPVFRAMTPDLVTFEEKKLCTLIASQLKSHYEHELYSQREAAIDYFEQSDEESFEFYGRRWSPNQHKSYRGTIDDKIAVMKHYKFVICYENTQQAPGYITEKIFDCFAAGTIPIYWGASNIEEYIPADCFIDRRRFVSMQELHAFMKAMSKEEYEAYILRIHAFLESDAAQKFSWDQLADAFHQAVAT